MKRSGEGSVKEPKIRKLSAKKKRNRIIEDNLKWDWEATFPLESIKLMRREPHCKIYEAFHVSHQKVIIKTSNDTEMLSKDYQIGRKFVDKSGIDQYLCLLKGPNGSALVIKDFGGISLHSGISFLKFGEEWKEFFRIANQLLDGLTSIHSMGIIHGSLCPYNVLISMETMQVRITDFSTSSLLSKEFGESIRNPMEIEQDLRYIAPEQTGRMNRDVDYRADFYSMGCVLYFSLLGISPLEAYSDPLELIHSHLAKEPIRPHSVNPSIPVEISELVSHLMTKNIDDRYQSHVGIRHDLFQLELLLSQRNSSDTYNKNEWKFKEKDIRSIFQVSQKLFGREESLSKLLSSFESVRNGTHSRILVQVSGYSGIGKSAFVGELRSLVSALGGFYISGKFDQFSSSRPFAPFIQSFQQLMRGAKGKMGEELGRELKEVLGDNASVLVQFIPEAKELVGEQPLPLPLGDTENQNRFNDVILQFLRVFCKSTHPLVIFLDDMQWSDRPTLQLIETILACPFLQYLCISIAYRSNEVEDLNHPLIQSIINISNSNLPIISVPLAPLSIENINEMTADTFSCPLEECKELSRWIHQKTDGNPFFVVVFMNSLYKDQLLKFDFEMGKWVWDLNSIANREITENVVEIMTRRIKELPLECQTLLSLASLVGTQFELEMLALCYDRSKEEIMNLLWPAMKDGLIIQLSERYKWISESESPPSSLTNVPHCIHFRFLHDRVQQVALHLMDSESSSQLHLKVGRLLRKSIDLDEKEENVYQIVKHYQLGTQIFIDDTERCNIAQLSLRAATLARKSNAYEPALQFAEYGIQILPKNGWETEYQLSFQLSLLKLESQALKKDYESAERGYEPLYQLAREDIHRVSVLFAKFRHYERQYRFEEGTLILFQALQLLGISIPQGEEELEQDWNDSLDRFTQIFASVENPNDFLKMKEIQDAKSLKILEIFAHAWVTTYAAGKQALVSALSARYALFCMENGLSEWASVGLVYLSFHLGPKTGNYKLAFDIGSLGIRIAKMYPNPINRAKAFSWFGTGICNYVAPLSLSKKYLEEAFQLASHYGDVTTAASSAQIVVVDQFAAGMPLFKHLEWSEKYQKFLKLNNPWIHLLCLTVTQTPSFLLNETGILENEEEIKRNYGEQPVVMAAWYFGRMILLFWEDSRRNWIQAAEKAMEMVPIYWKGCHRHMETWFYGGLILLLTPPSQDPIVADKREKLLRTSFEFYEKLAQDCVPNALHKLRILQGQRAVNGNKMREAVEYFEEAIDSASQHGFIQFKSLANELLARYWYETGREAYAIHHLSEALGGYTTWGGHFRVQTLKKKFANLVLKPSVSFFSSNSLVMTCHEMDAMSLIQTIEAVSQENKMNLPKFLFKMMKIALQNAGATRGVLLADVDPSGSFNELSVVAEGTDTEIRVETVMAIPLSKFSNCPLEVLKYVQTNKETVVITNCMTDFKFKDDPYFASNPNVKSVMAVPMVKRNVFKGCIYLENNLTTDAFTDRLMGTIQLLCSQIAYSLESDKYAALIESEGKTRAIARDLELNKVQLEEFIDVLCHELRNPLNGVCGNQESLQISISKLKKLVEEESSELWKELQENLEGIRISSDHLKDIIDNVLTMSYIKNGKTQFKGVAFSPLFVANEVHSMFAVKAKEKNLQFLVEVVPQNLPQSETIVIGDPYRFKQLLINLVSNCMKFTHKGSIKVTFNSIEREGENGIRYSCSVVDTGIGMDQSEQNNLFQKFSQANQYTAYKYGGSGLGLMIVKELSELMGGKVSVQSKKGKGSTFYFSLLFHACNSLEIHAFLSERDDKPQIELIQTEKKEKDKDKRVLIVEDNMVNQKLLKRIMESDGFRCDTACNGVEAVQSYTTNQYELILMDIQMPIMDGTEATKKIRMLEAEEGRNKIMIIGISANARDTSFQQAHQCGMDGYITKPYHRAEIKQTIERLSSESSS